MVEPLYNLIEQINEQYQLEIELDTIAELYGSELLERLAETPADVEQNIQCLISLNFGETVADICNRFGPLLCEDPATFSEQVHALVDSMGEDYVQIMGEDMTYWEQLM